MGIWVGAFERDDIAKRVTEASNIDWRRDVRGTCLIEVKIKTVKFKNKKKFTDGDFGP